VRLLVCCEVDPASVNIRTALLHLAAWREIGAFGRAPVLEHGPWVLVTIPDEHLYRDRLDVEVREALGITAEVVVYASRHRSAAGRRALTVHPIGNFTAAEFGGRAGSLVPAAPGLMGAVFRALRVEASGMGIEATLECTHHGPWLETAAFYAEVGSDESGWRDAEAAAAVARALLAATPAANPVAVGFGGGHYVPRMTDLAGSGRVDPGHLASQHAIQAIGAATVDLAVEATSGATQAVFQTRAGEREAHRLVRARALALGLLPFDPPG